MANEYQGQYGLYYSGNFTPTVEQRNVNAEYLMRAFTDMGWNFQTICGMMANFQSESAINPGRWENNNPNIPSKGYGLVQWTPSTKFTNWCNANGLNILSMDSATARIEYERENRIQWGSTNEFNFSFTQFKVNELNMSAYDLACAFARNYERSRAVIEGGAARERVYRERGGRANQWVVYFGGTPLPPGRSGKGMSFMFYPKFF